MRSGAPTVRVLTVLALAAVILAGVAGPARLLFAWPVPLGLDGYYYVLQVESIRSDGLLWRQTPFSGGVRALALIGLAFGDVVFANKVAVLVGLGTLIAFTFAIVRLITGSAKYALLGSAVLALSPLRYYFVAEYIGQLFAMLWYACAVCLWLLAVLSGTVNRRAIYALFGVGAAGMAVWTHKSGAVMFLATASCLVGLKAWRMLTRVTSRGMPFAVALAGGALLVSVALAAAYQFLPSARPWLSSNARPLPVPDLWDFSFAPESVFLVISASIFAKKRADVSAAVGREAMTTFVVIVAIALIFCANPFLRYKSLLDAASERLGLTALLWAPILAAVLFRVLDQSKSRQLTKVVTAAVVGMCFVPRAPYGAREAYLHERVAIARALTAVAPDLYGETLIIAEHGTQFLVTAITEHRASSPARFAEPVGGSLSMVRDRNNELCSESSEDGYCLPGWTLLPTKALQRWAATATDSEFQSITRQNRPFVRWLVKSRGAT